MRIKLIHPSELDPLDQVVRFRKLLSPGLTLPYLAALIPGKHDIELIEDSVELINYDKPTDLVGITATTAHAPRAYQIADEYRKHGVPVILGGFHPTFCYDEAKAHCDSVVLGEAEGLFEIILDDLDKKDLKPFYKRETPHDLVGLPTPRYDLIKSHHYQTPFCPVQTSRGCPYRCFFCSVTRAWGNTYRFRPVEDVARDIRAAGKLMFIVDDNFAANPDYTIEILRHMKDRMWFSQSHINIAQNRRLIDAMRLTGGGTVCIGFESLNMQALSNMRKTSNKPSDYPAIIKMLHRNNLNIVASVIVGFDEDGPEIFDDIISFLNANKLDGINMNVLTPYPGTEFFESCSRGNRLLTRNWSLYNSMRAVFMPRQLTPEELEVGYWRINRKFYSFHSIARRLLFPPHLTWSLFNLMARDKVLRRHHALQGEPIGATDYRLSELMRFIAESRFVANVGKTINSIVHRSGNQNNGTNIKAS